jgi:hypothetical protein
VGFPVTSVGGVSVAGEPLILSFLLGFVLGAQPAPFSGLACFHLCFDARLALVRHVVPICVERIS